MSALPTTPSKERKARQTEVADPDETLPKRLASNSSSITFSVYLGKMKIDVRLPEKTQNSKRHQSKR